MVLILAMDENFVDDVDPRVKDQLELLNSYTDEINSLELQLDEANATFRNTLSEYSQRLKLLAKRLGKCVEIARPYYEAEEVSRKAKVECEEAAVRFHRACGIHKEARETIAVAEQKFNAAKDELEFDAAWQEMLNRETRKVMNAESLKEESEKEHERKTRLFSSAVNRVKVLEQQLKKEIAKSRPYFEQKAVFLKVLQDLKSRVESLQKAVMDSKAAYSTCLHNLEMISKEIHERRKLLSQPREPGVGAEHEYKSPDDFCIYAPLANLQLSDNESQCTDYLSTTTDTDANDEINDSFTSSSAFVPILSLPLLEVTPPRRSSVTDVCLATPPLPHQKISPAACDFPKSCANTSWSGDQSMPMPSNFPQKLPLMPSSLSCCDYDAFEEVDLTCD